MMNKAIAGKQNILKQQEGLEDRYQNAGKTKIDGKGCLMTL